MKYLNYYSTRGLNNKKEIFTYLMDTLKESIFTWDYFVDFNKVNKNVSKIKKELLILNNLLGLSDNCIDAEFVDIITKYPGVRRTLPILIALRTKMLKDRPIIDNINTMVATTKQDLFNPKLPLDQQMIDELKIFFNESGLRDFFISGDISNIVDYYIGLEVGMDTHARKNRTGSNMESLIENYLNKFCSNFGFEYMSQATKIKIESQWNINIEVDEIARRFDFAVLSPCKDLTLIEVNYYGSGGSKLKATAGEYKALEILLSEQNHNFIWITDGLGWKTARTALYETFVSNDFIFNLEMVKNGILEEALMDNR